MAAEGNTLILIREKHKPTLILIITGTKTVPRSAISVKSHNMATVWARAQIALDQAEL